MIEYVTANQISGLHFGPALF